jgi:malate synthase
VRDLAPKNAALLAERDRLQSELDAGTRPNPGPIRDMAAYRGFLEKIGYLVPPPKGAKATTTNVDAELALQAGPQLVVPILNARYALNAANARWGSLYDALYGTDVIPEDRRRRQGPRLQRGARRQGDRLCAPGAGPGRAAGRLARRLHRLQGRRRQAGRALKGGKSSGLKDPAQFVGYRAMRARRRRCC